MLRLERLQKKRRGVIVDGIKVTTPEGISVTGWDKHWLQHQVIIVTDEFELMLKQGERAQIESFMKQKGEADSTITAQDLIELGTCTKETTPLNVVLDLLEAGRSDLIWHYDITPCLEEFFLHKGNLNQVTVDGSKITDDFLERYLQNNIGLLAHVNRVPPFDVEVTMPSQISRRIDNRDIARYVWRCSGHNLAVTRSLVSLQVFLPEWIPFVKIRAIPKSMVTADLLIERIKAKEERIDPDFYLDCEYRVFVECIGVLPLTSIPRLRIGDTVYDAFFAAVEADAIYANWKDVYYKVVTTERLRQDLKTRKELLRVNPNSRQVEGYSRSIRNLITKAFS